MILLTGATGVVGAHLLPLLSGRDDLRGLARTDESARRLEGAGVEMVRGDAADPSSLDPAFHGVERLFLLTPDSPIQHELEHNLLDAAQRAGVRRVVKISLHNVGLDTPFAAAHREIERRLERSDFETTILRPASFHQNLLGDLEALRAGSLHQLAGDQAVPHVDVADVAEVAAVALTTGDGIEGVYELTGPERLTWSGVAERIAALTGRQVAYVPMEPGEMRARLLAQGATEYLADGLVDFYETLRMHGINDPTPDVERALGRPPRPTDDFVRDELGPRLEHQG